MKRLVILSFIILLSSTYSVAQQPMELSRFNGTVTIDGIPNEAGWKDIETLPFTSYYPEAGKVPSESSDVRIAYDNDYLYVAGQLYESEPEKIQATTYRRDHVPSSSSVFGICLDTFRDNVTAFCFFVTPTGNRTDLEVVNDSEGADPFNFDWNTFWNAETVRNEEGWFAEMRIPFSSLRYQSKTDEVGMGIIVLRWIARKNESSRFPGIPNKWGWYGQFKPSQAQPVVFEDVDHKNPLQIKPYLLGGLGQRQRLNNAGAAYYREDDYTYDAGLDLKYGISSNLTVDLTLNTDFAQVEADNQQVNLTRYSLFFPEKRKFFQERSDLFDFGFGGYNRLFYSRRIGISGGRDIRILGGARLTGSMGKWDLGLINMQTAREQAVPSENFGVLRLRRQVFNEYSYAGTMLTSRLGADGSYNYAMGVDGTFKLFGNSFLQANAAQTLQDGQNTGLFDPDALRLYLQLERRSIEGFGYDLEYSRAGSRYNPGVGFELREDFTKWGNRLFYGWFPGENSPVLNYQLSVNASGYHRNRDGSVETMSMGPAFDIEFKSGSSMGVGTSIQFEDLIRDFGVVGDIIIPAGSYTNFPVVEGYYNTPSTNLLSYGVTLSLGGFYDGYRWSADVAPTWSISSKVKLNGFYQVNRLHFPDRDEAFTAHLGRLRMEYYFSNELSISAFVQYSNAAEQLNSNFRLRYNPREGNDLYIVYNEGLNTDRYSYSPVRPLSNRRTVLVKYSYTFNY